MFCSAIGKTNVISFDGSLFAALYQVAKLLVYSFLCRLFQVRAVDEMNYDFQALALESRGMGEVRSSS